MSGSHSFIGRQRRHGTHDSGEHRNHLFVREETARIMGMAEEELSLTQPLSDIGMDSLTVLELACALEERTGVRMNSAAGFAGANIRSVADRLASSLTDDSANDQSEALIEAMSQQHGVSLSEDLKQAALKA